MEAEAGGVLRADHEGKAVAVGVPYLRVLNGSDCKPTPSLEPSKQNGPDPGSTGELFN
jgi:hypothetical protein